MWRPEGTPKWGGTERLYEQENGKEIVMELKINILAVLAAVAVNFILGFVWYAVLFAKVWGKEMGYDPDMRPDRKTMLKGMALMVVGNFFFAWVLLSTWRAGGTFRVQEK